MLWLPACCVLYRSWVQVQLYFPSIVSRLNEVFIHLLIFSYCTEISRHLPTMSNNHFKDEKPRHI